MQTILGANGQIAQELARALRRTYTDDLRLVSRTPRPVNTGDQLVPADLLDAEQTLKAVESSDIVYFTAGLPPDSGLWERQFPSMLKNALDAAVATGAAFAYFDNTYMYPQTAAAQTEDTAFAPAGRKARVRAEMARMVLDEMAAGRIAVTIARAPEFYGPGNTQSFTNALVIDRLKAGKSPRVPLRDDTLRTLIWTPDASRALALLGNTPDAQNQTWHLPCSEPRLTYAQFATLACTVFGRPDNHATLGRTALYIAGLFSKGAREIRELLPRYEHDNRFESGKFKQRFPDFPVTSYDAGLRQIKHEWETGK